MQANIAPPICMDDGERAPGILAAAEPPTQHRWFQGKPTRAIRRPGSGAPSDRLLGNPVASKGTPVASISQSALPRRFAFRREHPVHHAWDMANTRGLSANCPPHLSDKLNIGRGQRMIPFIAIPPWPIRVRSTLGASAKIGEGLPSQHLNHTPEHPISENDMHSRAPIRLEHAKKRHDLSRPPGKRHS